MEFKIKRRRGRIEIVPMIDVMFFMLVFFMLFSTFDKAKAGIEVELPKALNIGAPQQDVVVISIDRNSQVFYGKKPVNMQQLKSKLLSELQHNAEARFVVRPDAAVPYADLIRVTDLMASVGVYKPLWGVDRGQMPKAEK
ncbi:MAG TPA: biopolymer transporter ExbD [Bacillota bacterium]|nr:biopolymer transporter ExbD [Bacillota bacterium]